MKPRITLITLGVDDLEKSLAFYRAFGLRSEGIVGTQFEHGAVAFFQFEIRAQAGALAARKHCA
jgi:catechol 2,3-dioxygenase-like lactoylglutathione lyase family enzyme